MANSKSSMPRVISTDEAGTILATFVPSLTKRDDGAEQTRFDVLKPDKSVKGALQTILDVFLPAGYPHSVTDDYLEYQIYDSLQAFSSSIAGLLSSRAVLEGVGVGDSTASTTSAVLLSILQESLGRLATILFAHRLGTALEPECKTFRLAADIFNDTAMMLECLSPAFPKPIRVVILAGASALKALCGVAAGSSKASLSAHFARWGNLGELNAKDSSQETVISLMGMWAGSVVVSYVRSRTATWIALLMLLALHLYTNYRAVRAVSMRSLNRQRAGIVFGRFLESRTILSPKEVSKKERIFEKDGVMRSTSGEVLGFASIGISFDEFLNRLGSSRANPSTKSFAIRSDEFAQGGMFGPEMSSRSEISTRNSISQRKYLLHVHEGSRHISIALEKSCCARDQLHAWFTAYRALLLLREGDGNSHRGLRQGRKEDMSDGRASSSQDARLSSSVAARAQADADEAFPGLERGLVEAGWDLDTAALETRRATRYAFVSE